MASESLAQDLDMALSKLPEREGKILRMFYGIKTMPLGLEEIGEKLHLSRERVRQIKEKGLALLRKAQKDSVLKTYL